MTRTKKIANRVGWTVIDQALSSISNFLLAVLIASTVSLAEFGVFSVAYSIYMFAMGASRALFSEPLLVRNRSAQPDQDAPRSPEETNASIGGALLVGTLIGAVVTLVGALAGFAMGGSLIAVGLCLPGLLLQDAFRMGVIADGSPKLAAANDALWAVLMVGGLYTALAMEIAGVATLIAAWGASGGLAALIGIVVSSYRPHVTRVKRFLRQHRETAPRFFGEYVIGEGSVHAGVWAIGAVAGLEVLGALRAAMTILGPIRVLIMVAPVAAVPELTRLLAGSRERFERMVRLVVVGLVISIWLWAGAAWLIPEGIGSAAFGDSWLPGRSVLLPMALWLALTAAYSGFKTGLRALGDARRSLSSRLLSAPPLVIGGILGAWLGGATGAAYGRAAGASVGVYVWSRAYRQAVKDWPATESSPAPVGDVPVRGAG
jgi:O-antigen/teichoic acid export membrane protein